jgi:hypothetical protein
VSACYEIICATNTSVIVVSQAKPKFSNSYNSSDAFGKVDFTADLEPNDSKLTNIRILSKSPSDVDDKIILEMIKNSRFRLYTDEKGHSTCAVKGYEFTFNFDLPERTNLEVEVGW